VRLYLRHVSNVPAAPSDPAFCYPGPGGSLRGLTFDRLASGIKHLVSAIGMDPSSYSTHSLRKGGATSAIRAGVDPLLVQAAGDWASPSSFQLYVVVSPAQLLGCTASMLRAVRSALAAAASP
jgi:site-specific recombinase XerD